MFSQLKRGRKKDRQASSDASNVGPLNNSSSSDGTKTAPAPPSFTSSSGARATSGPGTATVGGDGGGSTVFRVYVPEYFRPGEEFHVYAGNRIVRVLCPPESRLGQPLQIIVPADPAGSGPPPPGRPQGKIPPDSPYVQPISDHGAGGAPAYMVRIPEGLRGGQKFPVTIQGQSLMVTCPPNARPGMSIRFVPPPHPQGPSAPSSIVPPKGRVAPQHVKLSYDKDGWTRTIRVKDMKFQWVRMDDKDDVDLNKRFDVEKSAYVRKLEFLEGSDPRIRDGILSLVPASEAVVDSKIKSADDRDLVSYADIAVAQGNSFEKKTQWFQHTCDQLCVEWEEGHMRINVRRDHLLSDSIDAVMSLTREDLRKVWRIEFIGEMGIDANGGLEKEWFQLVTEEIFDPDFGLWQPSAVDQMRMQINPASEISFPNYYLIYFRFLGRVMGKALFDRQLVAGHMVQYLYKHILGWPTSFGGLPFVDEEYYNNLKQLEQMAKAGEDLELLCLDFTTTQESLGTKEEVELVKGGADIEVTNENFPEYLEACFVYQMMGRVKPQMTELLLGFFDVIPEPLLTIFDFQELELLMCGLPQIDVKDWMEHTEYSGEYYGTGGDHPVCGWFWEVVSGFDHEMKLRLLQFVTGTSGVPSRGFEFLHGPDGNIRKFTIHGVGADTYLYPQAYTCFNRIDPPIYKTKEDLQEKLKLAVTMVATGFDME